jgi:hypothetical protein
MCVRNIGCLPYCLSKRVEGTLQPGDPATPIDSTEPRTVVSIAY